MEKTASRVGLIRCAADWAIKGTNRSAVELLECSDLVGTQLHQLDFGRVLLERSSSECPYSRYIDCRLGNPQLLVNVARSRSEYVITFEPAEWSFVTWRQFDTNVLVTDETGRILFVHYGNSRPSAVPEQLILGRNIVDLGAEFAPEIGPTAHGVAEVVSGKTDREYVDIPFPDGNVHSFNVRMQPWRYCGCACGVIIVATDVTHVTDAAVQEASVTMYRVLNTLQHELRNPLQTMQAAIDTLRESAGESEQSLLRVLGEQILTIKHCLSNQRLIRLSAPEAASLVKLSGLVRREIERTSMHPITSKLVFVHRRLEREPLVRVRVNSVSRIFMNLFANLAQLNATAHVNITYAIRDRCIACTVTADGPGFPPEVLTTDWLQPEVPTKHVGLVLAASTLEAHGGAVVFGNQDSGGAFIELRIPTAPDGQP